MKIDEDIKRSCRKYREVPIEIIIEEVRERNPNVMETDIINAAQQIKEYSIK